MATTLLVPGLDGGGEGHWLSWFKGVLPDAEWVVQENPQSLDLCAWAAAVRWQLMRADEPVVIVAHGFGCLAAVRAAADCADRVEAAMLVAPMDPDGARLASLLPEEPLSFPAVIVASSNDPRLRLSKAAFWASYWSCDFVDIGRAGSVDPAAGFGPWPAGLSILEEVRRSPAAHLRQIHGREMRHQSRAI
jgi:predicted alpha/beta hydrolase family esterase